jgi:hypothetical protein
MMNGDQNDYALSLGQDELHALATLIHDECKCVPANNGGGDCDWCRVYYGTTDLTEEIKACVTGLRDEIRCCDILLKGRADLLAELPECRMHGSGCIPNGVDSINALKAVAETAAKILRGMVFTRDTPGEQLNVTWQPMCIEDAKHKDDECQSAWDELEQALAALKQLEGDD